MFLLATAKWKSGKFHRSFFARFIFIVKIKLAKIKLSNIQSKKNISLYRYFEQKFYFVAFAYAYKGSKVGLLFLPNRI